MLWTKKYFIVFSREINPSEDIIGKNLNIFISSDNHKSILEILLKAKITLKNKNIKNIINGVKIIF